MKTLIKTSFLLLTALFSVLAFPYAVRAQEKKEKKKRENVLLHPDKFYQKYFPGLRVKRHPPDSSFIMTYPNYLSAGTHVFSPSAGIDIRSRKSTAGNYDASSKFRTNISDVIGFVGTYKLVSAGFAFLSNSGPGIHSNYAPSKYHTATIKYNGAAYAFQFKYIRIKGFTDINQGPAPEYTQRQDILSKEYQFEGVYNLSWKKYSYIAPLSFSQRQLISHAGFLVKTGVFYNQLSGDAPLISAQQQPYFDNFSNIKAIRSFSMRIAPGFGGNLVFFKRFYLSVAAFTSFDLYFYKYLQSTTDQVPSKKAFVMVLDGKSSIGYQSKRLYAGLRFEQEKRVGALHSINMNMIYTYAGIELGYRFTAPSVVKKVYKKTLPPGM